MIMFKIFLAYNLINAYRFGGITAVRITQKLGIYIKDERCLRFIQNDKLSSYEELLEKDG